MPDRTNRRRILLPALVGLSLACAAAPTAGARVDVSLDADSLNAMLSAMAPRKVDVKLTEGRGVTLRIEDLRVTGFDPTEGAGGEGFVLTSLRLKVPELGLDFPVESRLSLQVRERDGRKVAFLRFEKVPLQLPISGAIDVAPLLPVLPLPTDSAWNVAAAGGNVRVHTRLLDAKMGTRMLRLGFDLDVAAVP